MEAFKNHYWLSEASKLSYKSTWLVATYARIVDVGNEGISNHSGMTQECLSLFDVNTMDDYSCPMFHALTGVSFKGM